MKGDPEYTGSIQASPTKTGNKKDKPLPALNKNPTSPQN